MMVPEEDGAFLLRFCRKTAEAIAKGNEINKPKDYPLQLDTKLGAFCTITKNGGLRGRGCAGVPAFATLLENAAEAAKAAAKEDPRFPQLQESELGEIKIELAILGEPQLISASPETYPQAIKEGDGLLLKYGPYEGIFPPQVWKTIKDKAALLDTLCLSAGLTEGMWKEKGARLYRFDAQVFSEE